MLPHLSICLHSVSSREECGDWQGSHHLFFDWWIGEIWEVWAWQKKGRFYILNLTVCESAKYSKLRSIMVLYVWQISVYPREIQPENPNSYRARKRENFRLQRERKKARKEGIVAQPQLVLASNVDAADSNPVCWIWIFFNCVCSML